LHEDSLFCTKTWGNKSFLNHTFAHLLGRFDMGDDDTPIRDLVLGPDVAGNIIELIVVVPDNGDELAIHAMPIRSRYLYLLPAQVTLMPKNKIYGTSAGRVVDDVEVARLVAEAEAGYDPSTLRRRGGRQLMGSAPAEVVPVRLDPELKRAVEQRAESLHSTTSEVIRQAIRSYLQAS
jgi:hypothetical protein